MLYFGIDHSVIVAGHSSDLQLALALQQQELEQQQQHQQLQQQQQQQGSSNSTSQAPPSAIPPVNPRPTSSLGAGRMYTVSNLLH